MSKFLFVFLVQPNSLNYLFCVTSDLFIFEHKVTILFWIYINFLLRYFIYKLFWSFSWIQILFILFWLIYASHTWIWSNSKKIENLISLRLSLSTSNHILSFYSFAPTSSICCSINHLMLWVFLVSHKAYSTIKVHIIVIISMT